MLGLVALRAPYIFYDVFGSRRVTKRQNRSAIRVAELREKRRVPGTDADGERERERERAGAERKDKESSEGKEETQLSEVWVEGKSLTWSPKRSSLSFLGEFPSLVSCGITFMSSPSSDPSLTRN